jgi:hypothetical protein
MTARLQRSYFDLHQEDWTEFVTFNLPYSRWVQLFGASGLVVDDLVELRPAADATSSYRDETDRAWALRWPMDQIWKLRKR